VHEVSIATAIAETVAEFEAAHPDSEILKVQLQIGELMSVESEQLKFGYASIIHDTSWAGSTLEIETVPLRIKCPYCHYEGAPKYGDDALTVPAPTLQCPRCGLSAEATSGHECLITSIQVRHSGTENAL